MLYELTTGRLPFTADDPVAVISQHLHAPVVPPRAHNEGIPPALDSLIVRLMSKRAEDRPASASEILSVLERLDTPQADAGIAPELSLLDSIVRGRLVGRGGELAALRERWALAQAGQGGMVLISGEPGIGKTRLADELIAYARLNGGLVLRGGCYDYEAATPYLPLAEALRDWAHAQPDESLRGGRAFLEAAQDKLNPETQSDELAHTLTILGRYHHYGSQHTQAIACYESARELAEPLDNAFTLSYLYAYLAGAYQHLARFDKSMEWANQCLALGERKDYPLAQSVGYEFLAEDLVLIGRWNEALECARLDREIGERIGLLDRVAWAEYCRASALYGLGDLVEARDCAASGLALAERIGDGRLITWLEGQLGFIEADLGADEAARSHAELAVTRANELGQVILQSWSLSALANLHVRHQEWEPALELCQQGQTLHAPTENRVAPLFLGAIAAEAQLVAGRLDEAAQGIATYLSLARETGALHPEAVALRVQGQILTAQERWDKAGHSFDTAIVRLDELGSRLELGRALYQRGIMRAESGQLGSARADARRAQDLFEECGASDDAETARSLLALA